jgi:hypothetical protein
MDTGKKPYNKTPFIEEGQQRDSNLKMVVRHLPARTKDNFLLLFLLLLGITGFAYIILVPVGQNMDKRSIFTKIFDPVKAKSQTSDSLKSNLLKIKGELKANEPVMFSFDKLSTSQDYKINFGDKQSEVVQSKQFTHTYTKQGRYNVRLINIQSDKEIVLHCEFIVIN